MTACVRQLLEQGETVCEGGNFEPAGLDVESWAQVCSLRGRVVRELRPRSRRCALPTSRARGRAQLLQDSAVVRHEQDAEPGDARTSSIPGDYPQRVDVEAESSHRDASRLEHAI